MRKILFIDDERELFEVISKIFPKEQYRVVCAADGIEGLMKYRNEEFDVIISDYRMPKLDGYKFYLQVREIQESKKKQHTPILFLSGYAEEIRSKKQTWDQCDFLNKPFQVYEIVQKVSKLLGDPMNVASNPSELKTDGKIFLEKGAKLVEEGDSCEFLYFVKSGVLSAYKRSAAGTEALIGNIYTGELIGEAGTDNSCHHMTIIAEEPCEIIVIPSIKISSMIEQQPKWIKLMLENMSKRLKQALKNVA